VKINLDPDAIAQAVAEHRRTELRTEWENAARTALGDCECLTANNLETLTGTKAPTWRYWASVNEGPASFKLGKRRVWRRDVALDWLVEQETAATAGAAPTAVPSPRAVPAATTPVEQETAAQ
jgi:prophage regulatory protein